MIGWTPQSRRGRSRPRAAAGDEPDEHAESDQEGAEDRQQRSHDRSRHGPCGQVHALADGCSGPGLHGVVEAIVIRRREPERPGRVATSMPDLQGQRVLVTGGGGFVGVPTVRALLEEGADVRVMDLRADALAGLDVEVIEGSVTDARTVERACDGVALVAHLAVLPLTAANTEVEAAFDINVLGCFNVFRAAGEAGARRVVYSSASSAYGPTEAVPIPDDHPLEPVAFYPATKAAGEMVLRGLAGTYGYGYAILRYMNVYGPGQRAGVVPAVARALLAGEAPTLTGDGRQAFDFVHIDDCARANVLALVADVLRCVAERGQWRGHVPQRGRGPDFRPARS